MTWSEWHYRQLVAGEDRPVEGIDHLDGVVADDGDLSVSLAPSLATSPGEASLSVSVTGSGSVTLNPSGGTAAPKDVIERVSRSAWNHSRQPDEWNHDSSLPWHLLDQPDPGTGGRSHVWPRGKVLGGSSSINGLCHAVGYKNFDNTATNLVLERLGTDTVNAYLEKSYPKLDEIKTAVVSNEENPALP